MPTSPLVSLITTVHNRQAYLGEALASARNQSMKNFELIVFDDGSTDQSLQVARHHAAHDDRIRVIASKHQGRAASLIEAHRLARGQYVGWLDSDDLLLPDALKESTAALQQAPSIGVAYTHHLVIDQNGAIRGIGKRSSIPYSPDRLLIDFMTFHFRLMRKDLYEQVGGIDPDFASAEDYDLCLKLSEITLFQCIPKPLYKYRYHPNSLSIAGSLEQVRYSAKAVRNAMVRRKLDSQYDLIVDVSSRFKLQPKTR